MALPTDYSGLTAWFRADAGYYYSYPTLATDGQAVVRWDDQSGNGRHLAQSSGAAWPTWRANIRNGLPVIRTASSPTSDYTSGTFTGQVAFSHPSAGTQFSVWRPTGGINTGLFIHWDGTYGTEDAVQQNTDGYLYAYSYNAWSSAPILVSPFGSWLLSTWMVSGTTCSIGNQDTRTASLRSHAVSGTQYNGAFYMRSAGAFEDKEVGEMIFYNRALSESERMGVEGYLAAKWGFSLPYGAGAASFMVI